MLATRQRPLATPRAGGEPMDRLNAGLVLGGRYRLVSRIASGGMGHVWQGYDEVLRRTVAVKVMRPHTEDEALFAERFRAEARHTAGLAHPNIATVFDYGEQDGYAFLVMELVSGLPLSEYLREHGPLSCEEVRSIMGQAALALAVAHDAGVVHRDIKPANMLIRADGQVKLTDFGIARAMDGSGHTRTGEVMGTPYYLSPEQALGRPATGASDLYALGVVAYELLTGSRPFDKGTPVATVLSHVSEAPPPLPEEVAADVRAAVTACMEKDPAARPQDGYQVAESLGIREGVGHSFRERATHAAATTVLGDAAAEELESAAAERPITLPTIPTLLTAELGQRSWVEPDIDKPLTDLEALLAALEPRHNPGEYAVVSVREVPTDVHPVLTFFEHEGLTLILPLAEAQERGLDFEVPMAWITLGAYRSVTALGYVPTVTTALYQAQVPVVASVGRWHTHLFVPAALVDTAMRTLERLSRAHRD